MITDRPRKNDEMTRDKRQEARLAALTDFSEGLKYKRADAADAKRKKKRGDAAKKKRETNDIIQAQRAVQQPQAPKRAEAVVREVVELGAEKEGGLDLSDLTYEQMEALKSYGGLTSNMTRGQVDEIVGRISPLTEDGTPFIISTPRPKRKFLSPRRMFVYDNETGKKIFT